MASLQELVNHLNTFNGSSVPTAEDQLDELWQMLSMKGWGEASLVVDQGSVSAFLSLMAGAVAGEARKSGLPRTGERVDALQLIQTFVANPSPRAFIAVDPYRFAFQLALRVREPKRIDQDNTNLCGPNSLLIQYAKASPLAYAILALNLYQKGVGNLDKLEIAPDTKLMAGYRADTLPEADYVVLGSLRNSPALLCDEGFIRNVGLLTKPGVLCQWLVNAGYTGVEDHTFFDLPLYAAPIDLITSGSLHGTRSPSFKTGGDNLSLMESKLAGGDQVIMNAEADLSAQLIKRKLTARTGGGASNAMTTHWTYVRQLSLSSTHVVKIKFYTWGKSHTCTNLPLADFLTRYAGFVSYKW